MKISWARKVFSSAVRSTHEVEIAVTRDQADRLRQALEVVEWYRKAAADAAGHKAGDSDWEMTRFRVKNDRVIVTVDAGACG